MDVMRSVLGMVVLLAIAFLLSVNKKKISLRTVGAALVLQVVIGGIMLWLPPGRWVAEKVAFGVAVNIEEIALDDLQLFFFSQPIHDFLYLFVFEITSIQFDGVNATLNLLNLHGCYLRARWQLVQRLQLVEDSSPSAPRTCRTIQESLAATLAISSRRQCSHFSNFGA